MQEASGGVGVSVAGDSGIAEVWPLFGVVLRTPRLVLRAVRDEDLPGLAAAALAGIHEKDRMPFAQPWTDAPPEQLVPNLARYQWSLRTATTREKWRIAFAIIHEGAVIGTQDLAADDFAVTRTVETGSWITQSAQGQGLGKEMRAAVLMFAFDLLGAEVAETGAAEWNAPSQGVSRALGYEPNGRRYVTARPGERDEELLFRVTPEAFRRPAWQLEVTGFEAAREFLLG